MKKTVLLLLILALLLPGAGLADGSPVLCEPGQVIDVQLLLAGGDDVPALVTGKLVYDDTALTLLSSPNVSGEDAVYLKPDEPCALSFEVNAFAANGTYAVEVDVEQVFGGSANRVNIPPVLVVVTTRMYPGSTPAPTAVAQKPFQLISVQITYVDQETYQPIAQEARSITRPQNIFPDIARLPEDYKLADPGDKAFVEIIDGAAVPGDLTFYCQNINPGVGVAVFYVNEDHVVVRHETVWLKQDGRVYANMKELQGEYVLDGKNSEYVTLRGSVPDPFQIIFYVRRKKA